MNRETSSATKEKMKLTRPEAVQRLHALARELELGEVFLGKKAFHVPENVHFEMKADREELEIELKWKTPPLEGRTDGRAAKRSEEPMPHS